MLLQVDGSRHQWLGPDGPWLTLIGPPPRVGGIDDATNDVPGAVFREQEDAQGYLLVLQQVARRRGPRFGGRGLPLALYSDRHTIFQSRADVPLSPDEILAGGRPRTQVGRVLEDLDITWIGARSPQAKGRVERLWRTLQDRWVQELRLRGVTTLEEANRVLPELLAQHNTRFRRRAATIGSAYRPLAGRARDVFCFKYWRTVTNDNVVTVDGRSIAIPPGPLRRSYAKARVEIREHLDGTASVFSQGKRIARQGAIAGPLRTRLRGRVGEHEPPPARPVRPAPPVAAVHPWSPPLHHPWRRAAHTTENGRQRFAAARLPSYTADSTTAAQATRTKSRNT